MSQSDDLPDSAEPEQQARQHIFVVNGSPDFLDLMRVLLQDEHYNVTTTNFVPRTFEQVAALHPDLLILDLVAGQRAGWDLLERLHAAAATTGIPVLVVSTSPQLLDQARALTERYGGRAFVAKPFDLEAMLTEVQKLIGPA